MIQISLAAARVNAQMTQEEVAKKNECEQKYCGKLRKKRKNRAINFTVKADK